jgi:hypothetical protein
MRRLLLLVPLVLAAALPIDAGGTAAAGDCTLTVDPPFLYAPPGGTVISSVRAGCTTPAKRIHVEATLTRDGTVVTSARRDCRRTASCWITTDASANDVPGEQVWCTTASASADGVDLGEQTACETEDF